MSAAASLDGARVGLLTTDLYQLTMLDAYRQAGMNEHAVFEFYCRRLPPTRCFLVTAGIELLLDQLETARFDPVELDWLGACGRFSGDFVDHLARWRFTGDVDATPEGTIMFADEPMLRIEAPIEEAQLVETLVINMLHFQTLIASKAARMVLAAPTAQLIDFGLRRAHGLETGIHAARAAYLAGFAGTATVAAGARFGIPLFGTMAHSFIQAHSGEAKAFLQFAAARPADTTFLIDTYDTEEAARLVTQIAGPLRVHGIMVNGVRIDSGDLAAHASAVRRILDAAGLKEVRIVASGGLDEWKLRDLSAGGVPIDAYGIGTSLTTSQDAPALDCAYKLVSYAGKPCRKRSEGKMLWPGAKQVFRRHDGRGRMAGDVVALVAEPVDGEPLLRPVMRRGRRLAAADLEAARERMRAAFAALPEGLADLDRSPGYPVEISAGIRGIADRLLAQGR